MCRSKVKEEISPRIRRGVELILRRYVKHIRDKVKKGDLAYIKEGLDEDIEVYMEVYKGVMGYWLKGEESKINVKVLKETIRELEIELEEKGYRFVVRKYPETVYRVGLATILKVKEGVVKDVRM